MNVTKLECPNCHAALDNDYGNAGIFFCKYCGQKMIVEEMQNAEYDLKIKKMEMDHETQKMAMEQKSQNMKYAHERDKEILQNKNKMMLILVSVGLIILLMLFAVLAPQSIGSDHRKRVKELQKTEQQVQEAIINGDYDLAIIKVNQLRLDDGYSTTQTEAWDAKREDYIELINKKSGEQK